MKSTAAAFETTTHLSFQEAVERCRRALEREGFGVLTEIDVQATLRKKLEVDTEPYLILGACHPPSAHKVLSTLPEAGVLLPCNVTVSREGGRTVVRALNPVGALGVLNEPGLQPVAEEVGAALERVVRSVES